MKPILRYNKSKGCENWKGKPGCRHGANSNCTHACHIERLEPYMRHDLLGKWRYRNGKVLTTMGSWDTKKEAEDWARWNNFDEGLYGEIIRNPDL